MNIKNAKKQITDLYWWTDILWKKHTKQMNQKLQQRRNI